MENKTIIQCIKRLANLYHSVSSPESKPEIHEDIKLQYYQDVKNYIDTVGSNYGISFLTIDVSEEELNAFSKEFNEPFVAFSKNLSSIFIFEKRDRKGIEITEIKNATDAVNIKVKEIDFSVFYSENNRYPVLIPTVQTSLFGANDDLSQSENEELTPFKKCIRLLKVDKKEIIYLYIYAIINGLVNLSLPIGVQSIIGLVMGAQISTSLVVLISLVILGVVFSGVLTIMQQWIVEAMQQRVFVRSSFEFAYRVPRLKLDALKNAYPPELINRFFETVTIQKTLPKLLIDFSTALLQILFGLLLLSFYHPAFLFLSIAISILIYLIIRFTGPQVMKASLNESKYKYEVAFWLEEIARTMRIFKLAGNTQLPTQKTDENVTKYLIARKQKFKTLINQFSFIILFKTIITGALLILGSSLVMNEQINIGQFIAAEIIIILILNSVEKVILSMENIYDLLTSVEKISNVTDIPLEREDGILFDHIDSGKGVSIEVKNLFQYSKNKERSILQNLSFKIQPGEVICISGMSGSGKSSLLSLIAGLSDDYKGSISFNGIPIGNINLRSLHDYVSENFANEMIFKGTVFENITVGRNKISWDDVQWAVNACGLNKFIQQLPDGYNTILIPEDRSLPSGDLRKLVLARCLAERPKLLLLEDFLDVFDSNEKTELINLLCRNNDSMTVLAISNDKEFALASDKVMLIDKGNIIHFDPLNEQKMIQQYSHIYK
jgi:ABC-type bacteriocin/lantibiotic exporter with double-glycine peptidase domain